MNHVQIIGVLGAIILVLGAGYPVVPVSHPAKSAKNWLFAVGGLGMLLYSTLNYLMGGTIFFVILQLFINFTSVLMMCNTSDKFDAPFISLVGLGMIAWSLSLFEGYNTVFFVIGLTAIGVGYALDTGTFKRNAVLAFGSAVIAVFSFIERDTIFFVLNIFFALFSLYHAIKLKNAAAK